MSEEQNQPRVGARFRIVSFKDIEWIMQSTRDTVADGEDLRSSMAVKIGGTHQVDPEKSLLMLLVTVEYIKNHRSEDRIVLLSYTNEATYEIENFSEVVVVNEDDSYAVPGGLLELFVSVTISTMRGILIAKTANSDLQAVHIPIITNIRELIQSWD